jgi:hypothetical protein
MIYVIAFYCLCAGIAELKLDQDVPRLDRLVSSLLIGWFNIPARLLAKLAM